MGVSTGDTGAGSELARAYFREVVEPILSARFPDLAYSAGRLGSGSDALGLDDATSRDHDWGLRLSVFVPDAAVDEVEREVDRSLPRSFRTLPTRFAFTGETVARHRVEVSTVADFTRTRLGFDPRAGVTVGDWLSVTGQAVLEVVGGPVFADRAGELEATRRALAWYPDDVWRHVLACDWARLAQELPSMGRAADVGDEAGSRIIAARLVQVMMHLAFLLERRWPPYAKWFGTLFGRLSCAADLVPCLDAVLDGSDRESRQAGFAAGLDHLLARQNALGLTDTPSATVPFWDRPSLQPAPTIVLQLREPIADPVVRGLPVGLGSVEQRTDLVDLLVDPEARRSLVAV